MEGTDTAHKLAILTSICAGTAIDLVGVYREGITDLTPMTFTLRMNLASREAPGHRANLGGRTEARVHPALIPKDHIMANVDGAYNAIYLDGDFVGPNLYYRLGVGQATDRERCGD